MNKIGYVVCSGTNKFYTYNKVLAVKVAQRTGGEIKRASADKIKKAIDISI